MNSCALAASAAAWISCVLWSAAWESVEQCKQCWAVDAQQNAQATARGNYAVAQSHSYSSILVVPLRMLSAYALTLLYPAPPLPLPTPLPLSLQAPAHCTAPSSCRAPPLYRTCPARVPCPCSSPCPPPHLGRGEAVHAAVRNVVGDCPAEQHRLLPHHRHCPRPLAQGEGLNRPPIQQNAALLGLVEPAAGSVVGRKKCE